MNETILEAEKRARFESRLTEVSEWRLKGRKQWSFLFHTTLYISLIASAAAAVMPQLQGFTNEAFQKNLTSILAGLAALMISLSTAGGFNRKWAANRITSGKVNQLKGELIARDPTAADAIRLEQIEAEHNAAIIG